MEELIVVKPVHIRWMIRKDFDRVLEIEKELFQFPWSEDDLDKVVTKRNCIGKVAELNDKIVAFIIYETYTKLIHIANLGVGKAYQRRGIAKAMIDDVKVKLSPTRRNKIEVNVRESNLGGQLFLRDQGFRAVKIMRDYYENKDVDEDSYLFRYKV